MTLLAKYRPLWIALIALIALPFAMRLLGLTISTASMVVILAIATLGLNLLVGYTGLTSFGHSAWFGIGAYAAGARAAALVQRTRSRCRSCSRCSSSRCCRPSSDF